MSANGRLPKSKCILDFFETKIGIREKEKIMVDILSIAPHQVSRDMRGYSVFLYGGWKTK